MQKIFYLILCVATLALSCMLYRHLNQPKLAFREGENHYARQAYAEAIKSFEGIVDAGYRPNVVWERLADAYLKTGQSEKAEAHFKMILEKQPRDLNSRMILAGIYARQGRFPDAESAYREVLNLSPVARPARLYLARVLTAEGKFSEAADEYRVFLGEKK